MNQTFQNSAQVLSMGVFFTLMIVGLSASLPHDMLAGPAGARRAARRRRQGRRLPAISILFAAFLGYNPIQHLVGSHVLNGCRRASTSPHRPLVLPAADLGLVPHAACTMRSCSRSSRA